MEMLAKVTSAYGHATPPRFVHPGFLSTRRGGAMAGFASTSAAFYEKAPILL